MQNKVKSLGEIKYPRMEVKSYNGSTGRALLTIVGFNSKGSARRITLDASLGIAHTLVDLARELTAKHRTYAIQEWGVYSNLKKKTGYTPPAGEN